MPDDTPVRWQPERSQPPPPWPTPPMFTAITRGLRGRCPACGRSNLFSGYLRVVPLCPACGAPLGRVPVDDSAPVFTILIVGAVAVTLLLVMEMTMALSALLETAILIPLTLVLALLLLRPVKGAALGLMLRLGMLRSPEEP
ncbi:MAG: DUF983 domain-containing protein [Rhodospirillales bacterium]|nr:DUF983 domain-containing protein [Rhodospirillales bacterium]